MSATVIAPVPELIANASPVLPPVIDHPALLAESPVDAIVSTALSSAAFSAIVAEFDVIAIATFVTVTVTVMVSVLAPSDTWRITTQVLALLPAPQPGAS